MRKLRLTVYVIILALLAACSPQGGKVNLPDTTSVQSPNKMETAQSIETEIETTATDTSAPIPTDSAIPKPESMAISIDKNVPDIAADSAEKACSGYMLYEDADNIYYLWNGNGLYSINKSNGKATLISSGCLCFTAYNGQFYFVDETDELKQYSGETASVKPIIKMDKEINSLACAGNRIYFTCNADIDSDEYSDILFSSDLNGNDQVKLHDNVDTFCLYNNRVLSITLGELGYIQEYLLDNAGNRKQLSNRTVYRNFDVSLDKIICAEFKDDVFNCSNNLVYDINTGKTKDLSIAYVDYVIAGQFMIDIGENDGQIVIKAYDFLADKEYALLDISDLSDLYSNIELHTTRDSIYLCLKNSNETNMAIYKVIISNGQARLEFVALVDCSG